MNKFSKLFCGIAMGGMLFSCSSDEPQNGPDAPETGDGVAYLKVRINDTDRLGRGQGTTDKDVLEYGSEDEHQIVDAKFYFFDESGTFITQTTLNKPGGSDGTTNNIEYLSTNVVTIQGLPEDELPTYMITVLNPPVDFAPAMTIDGTAKKLLDRYTDRAGNFVMSTSSFFDGGKHTYANGSKCEYNDTYYYANKLTAGNFKKTPEEAAASDNITEVYVERVAAKVEIVFGSTVSPNADGFYEVKTTVAGNVNGDINAGGAPQAGTVLYIKFDNWGISNSEKQSYLSKNLTADAPWSFSSTATSIGSFNWNDADRFRSYWGASVSYGSTTPNLHVVTYSELTQSVNKPGYAFETTNDKVSLTNTVGGVNYLASQRAASALLSATVYEKLETPDETTDAKGYRPIDMVLYNGVYYREDQFKKYVLSILESKSQLNYYICLNPEATDTKNYRQVDERDIKLVKNTTLTGTARVELAVNADALTLYSKSTVDGKDKFDEITDGTKNLNNALAGFFHDTNITGETNDKEAIAYKGGKMYYTIPVEHLVDLEASDARAPYKVESEANYGLVRNHWYKITINKLANLGHGIFNPGNGSEDPGEPLVPDNPDNDRWSLGARINILSWKIVKQNVDL